jgi:uncharacterized protein YciI
MYAVVLEHGPPWDSSQPIEGQAGWPEHAEFMDGLVDEGFLVLGGPIGEGERVLLAVHAVDAEAIRSRLAADPWHRDGLLLIASIEPWTIRLDGRNREPWAART